jgi:CRP-like cAMP-binding protein
MDAMPPDPRELREQALSLIDAGKHDKAADRCLELAKMDKMGAGDWARRAADCYRRVGKRPQEIAALAFSAEAFQQLGQLVKAVAVCKAILAIDPSHTATQARLAALHADENRPSLPLLPPPVPPKAGAPISAISLSQVVPGAAKSDLTEEDAPTVYVIPLEEIEIGEAEIIDAEPAPAERAREVLPRTPLFSDLSPESLQRLIERAKVLTLADDEIVCRQGEFSDDVYVVVEGAVRVMLERPHAADLGTLGEGEFFGEVALLTGGPRSATVRAVGPTELLVIGRNVIGELIEHEPAVLTVVLRFLRERLLRQLAIRNPLFGPFADEPERFQLLEIELGNTIIREGEKVKGLYVLMAGEAQALRTDERGEHAVGDLMVGDLCGEMSLLSGAPAVATVRAASKCLALFLSAKEFREAIMVHSQLLELVATLADERRAKNEQIAEGRRRYTEEHLPLT